MKAIILSLLVLVGSTAVLVWGFSELHCDYYAARSKASRTVLRAKKPRAINEHKNKKNPKALEACIDLSLEQENKVVVLVDSNNVRGKTDFEWTNRDLLRLLEEWKTTRYPRGVDIICVVDHGCQARAFEYSFGLVVFAGPHRTADDVIAQATRWLDYSSAELDVEQEGFQQNTNDVNTNIFVVTSDGELKQRCLRNNRSGNQKRKKRKGDTVKVFGSLSFVRSLQELNIDLHQTEGLSSEGHLYSRQSTIEKYSLELEEDLRRYRLSRPPWSGQQEKLEALERGPWQTSVLHGEIATKCWPLQRNIFDEKTWHRVLFAENLRRMMTRLLPLDSNTRDGFLGKYQTRFNSAADEDEKATSYTMFLDHRIKYEPYLMQEFLHYLDQAVHSVTTSTNSSSSTNITHTTPKAVMWSPAVESCAELLRDLVRESLPGEIQDDLLSRYINKASSRLQFSRTSDLRFLLLTVATLECREEDELPQWYLRPDSNMGRRNNQKGLARKSQGGVVDEAMVEMGRVAESRWFKLLKSE